MSFQQSNPANIIVKKAVCNNNCKNHVGESVSVRPWLRHVYAQIKILVLCVCNGCVCSRISAYENVAD